jgi:hypothetical protein
MRDGVVVLADVKGSRRRRDRADLANRLPLVLRRLNRQHRRALLGRFEVQKGVDEFGGVLRASAPLGTVVRDLWEGLHPVPVRLAVVRGPLDVRPRSGRAGLPGVRAFDGPAFHAAAAAAEELRSQERFLRLRPRTPGTERLELLADAAYLHLLRWTPRQLAVVQAYRQAGGQAKAGRALGISQPAVSDALTRAQARTLLAGFDHLEATLAEGVGP